ncbi:MAG: hypothetical protein ACI4GZ_03385 [Ruminococcus sp.]
MKKTTVISIILTAAALLICLCGVFFGNEKESSAVSAETEQEMNYESFSLEKAKECMLLCAASYQDGEAKEKLTGLGYENTETFTRLQEDYFGSGISFTVGTRECTGNERVDGKSEREILVVFRGTQGAEWYSNFSIGTSDTHAGFTSASDFALSEIESYINRYSIDKSKTKILLTGHSRGGAVANLTSKALADEGEFLSLTAYTFASPNTTVKADAASPKYSGIYNIVNPEDFIAYIPPTDWGYTKYGVTLELPKEGDENFHSIYKAMQKRFCALAGYKHTGYKNGYRDIEAFLDSAVAIAPTVQDYYNREISVPPYSLTLYEYMQNLASLLCEEKPLCNGLTLMSGSSSPELRALSGFMMDSIGTADEFPTEPVLPAAVICAHTGETYYAYLEVLEEEYFLAKTANTTN